MNDNNLKIIEIANIIRDLIPNSEVEFLNNSVEVKKSIFIDRKIKEGKDKRTYKVSFDKQKKNINLNVSLQSKMV